MAVNGVCAISAVHIGRRYGLKRSKSSVASSNDEAILWTCVEVVQHYINRVQAYNGVSRCTTRCSLSLSGDCTRYVSTSSYTPTKIPEPGLPFSLVFRADPGSEDVLLEIASAYEAASKRRVHRRHSAHFRLILNQ